jgi:hypothetical protein
MGKHSSLFLPESGDGNEAQHGDRVKRQSLAPRVVATFHNEIFTIRLASATRAGNKLRYTQSQATFTCFAAPRIIETLVGTESDKRRSLGNVGSAKVP